MMLWLMLGGAFVLGGGVVAAVMVGLARSDERHAKHEKQLENLRLWAWSHARSLIDGSLDLEVFQRRMEHLPTAYWDEVLNKVSSDVGLALFNNDPDAKSREPELRRVIIWTTDALRDGGGKI